MKRFTAEEECFLNIFNTHSRATLMRDIYAVMPRIDSPEMVEIAQNCLRKLRDMTDSEYAELMLIPISFEVKFEGM